jgi:hypothetical protein
MRPTAALDGNITGQSSDAGHGGDGSESPVNYLQGSKGYLDGLKAAGLPVNDGLESLGGTSRGSSLADPAPVTEQGLQYPFSPSITSNKTGLSSFSDLARASKTNNYFLTSDSPSFTDLSSGLSIEPSGFSLAHADSAIASRGLTHNQPLGTDESRSFSIMRGPLGSSQNYGNYIVAVGADRLESLGGAIGRTDVLSSKDQLHQCVALLQAYGAGYTSTWEPGQRVTPGVDLPQNAMIASFERDANGALKYSGHAALFDRNAGGFNSKGLNVIDQYESGLEPGIVHQRTIRNHLPESRIDLGGDAKDFYVIKVPTRK